jgi:hypothetical protein
MHARSISHTAAFVINQAAETVFPLFSPEGERLWVPGWEYDNIMGTTRLHEDDVFLTRSHDHAAAEAVWIVKKYDPETRRVQFYKVEPNEKVGTISVRCDPLDPHSTRVEVTYTYLALSDSGNRFIENFSEKHYKDFIEEWKTLLEAYFEKRAD